MLLYLAKKFKLKKLAFELEYDSYHKCYCYSNDLCITGKTFNEENIKCLYLFLKENSIRGLTFRRCTFNIKSLDLSHVNNVHYIEMSKCDFTSTDSTLCIRSITVFEAIILKDISATNLIINDIDAIKEIGVSSSRIENITINDIFYLNKVSILSTESDDITINVDTCRSLEQLYLMKCKANNYNIHLKYPHSSKLAVIYLNDSNIVKLPETIFELYLNRFIAKGCFDLDLSNISKANSKYNARGNHETISFELETLLTLNIHIFLHMQKYYYSANPETEFNQSFCKQVRDNIALGINTKLNKKVMKYIDCLSK